MNPPAVMGRAHDATNDSAASDTLYLMPPQPPEKNPKKTNKNIPKNIQKHPKTPQKTPKKTPETRTTPTPSKTRVCAMDE
mmetsp:Transcript_18232/g.36796  ORF Transcript_18232/g.36796 Transcript_18232/m.36796 type:complete len:80 (+) Transcript_18232:348-587(+)